MKKLLSIFLAFSLLFSLCVPVLAAGPADQVLTYSLDVGGEHDITVETGDVITVNYVIINGDTEESAYTITTQDQIKYDHKFFELVEGSNLVSDGSGKDFAGNDIVTVEEGFLEFYDLTEAFEKSLPVDNKGEANEIRYVFFNSTSDCEIYPGEAMLVGSFQLEVIATEGSSVVESPDDETNLKYFATGEGSVHFGAAKQDLTVTIGGGVEKTEPTVTGTPTASVTYGDAVAATHIATTGVTVMDGETTVPGTWAWKSDVTSYGDATNGTPKTLKAVFTPTDTTTYKSVEVDVAVTVNKAAAPTLTTPQNVSQKFTVTGEQTKTVDITGMPENAGTPSFKKADNATGNATVTSWSVDSTTGVVSFTISGTAGQTATLPVKVSSKNYNDATVNVVITLTDKETVTLSGAAVADKTYDGDPVAVKTYPVGKIDAEQKISADAANWTVTYYKKTGDTTWSTALDSAPTDIGEYKAEFDVPAANPDYKSAGAQTVTFAIVKGKVDNTVLAKLGAYNEAYDGNAHGAVTGTTELSGYTLTYSTTGATEGFGSTMPQLTTVADSKSVWVKVSDANHESVVKLDAKVTKADNALTINAPSGVTYGDTGVVGSVKTQTFGAATDVTYTFSNTQNGTYAAWDAANAAGTWYVKGTIAGTDNYNAVTSEPVSFTVAAKAIDGSVTVSNTSPKYGDTLNAVITSVTPEAARTGLTYQWYRGGDAISGATNSSYKAVSADVGQTLKVKVTGNGNYKGELTSAPTAAVDKADQNPTITPTKTLYVGGAAFDLNTLVSDAIGTVTFEMAASDAAKLSGSSLTPTTDPTKTGEVKITVKAAGNDNYNAYTGTDAITVTVSSKSAANVTISGAQDKTYGDQNFTLTASAANKEQTGGTWTWDVGSSGTFQIVSGQGTSSITVKILKANTTGATITASYEDATYIGSDDATVKVAKATPAYTAPTGLTATYGQTLADVTLPAGWSWMASSTSVGNASETPATFNAKFTPADTDNYNVVENIDVNVTVGKASKTATTPVISAHTDTTITATAVLGQKYQIRKSSEAAPTAASTGWSDTAAFTGLDCNTAYKVYTYIPGDDNHEASPVLSTAQTTDKTTISGTVTVSNTSPKYGDTLNAVITSVTPEAARSGLTYQWYRGDAAISGATSSSYKAVSADVGQTLKVKVTANGNYTSELTSASTAAVAKKELTITGVTATSRAYEEGNTTVALTGGTLVGVVSGDTVSFTLGDGTVTADAGENKVVTTNITLTGEDKDNYTLTQPEVTVNITKAAQTAPDVDGTAPEGVEANNGKLTGLTDAMEYSSDGGTTWVTCPNGELTGLGNGTYLVRYAGDDNHEASEAVTIVLKYEAAIVPVTREGVEEQKVDVKISGTNAELLFTTDDRDKLGTVVNENVDADVVTIDLTGVEASAENETGVIQTVDIPKEALDNIAEMAAAPENNVTKLEIKMADGTAKFDAKALAEIKTQAGTNGVKLVVVYNEYDAEQDEYKEALTAEQKTTLESRREDNTDAQQTVYEIHLEKLDGTPICTEDLNGFGEGKASVTVKHLLPAGATNVKVFYLRPDGTTDDIPFTREGDYVVFEADHFSDYVISYKESGHTPGPGPSVDYNTVRIGTMTNGKVAASHTAAIEGRTITLTVTPNDGYQLTALTVTDGSNKTVKVTDLGNGKYSFAMPGSDVRVNATFTKKSVVSDCPRDYTCPIEPFTDTVNDAWWHDGIHYCVEKGLMNGVANATFAPNSPLTRGMIVTILWRMEGSPVTNYAMSFKDVKAGQWYTEAIRWAQSTGVVLGYSDDAFGPNDDITREQLAAILYRYANYKGIDVSARSDLAQFNDAGKISGWALDNVKWAVKVGMINGTSTTTIAPTDYTNRAQAAAMIQRFCENILGR